MDKLKNIERILKFNDTFYMIENLDEKTRYHRLNQRGLTLIGES